MKIDLKIIVSMLLGGALVWGIMTFSSPRVDVTRPVASTENIDKTRVSQVDSEQLKSCEVFFSDDRDNFESEINSRLPKAKLLQSNVLWSETTKQLGFYALICF